MKNNWKDKLDFNFYQDGIIRVTIEKKEIKSIVELDSFIESLLTQQKKELLESQIDKIKHEYNGYGGVLGFKCNDLIKLILKTHE